MIETGEGLGVEEGLVQTIEARVYHDGGRIICREKGARGCRDELESGQKVHEMSKKMEALMVREGWDRIARTGLLMKKVWF